jgi:hypothetical protein
MRKLETEMLSAQQAQIQNLTITRCLLEWRERNYQEVFGHEVAELHPLTPHFLGLHHLQPVVCRPQLGPRDPPSLMRLCL